MLVFFFSYKNNFLIKEINLSSSNGSFAGITVHKKNLIHEKINSYHRKEIHVARTTFIVCVERDLELMIYECEKHLTVTQMVENRA